jgi:hypothetical protein
VDAVPADYFLGERAIYVKLLKANLLVSRAASRRAIRSRSSFR